MNGYNDAGRLPAGKKGGRGRKLYEKDGVFYVWQRPKGRWRPAARSLRRLGAGSGGGSDGWVRNGNQRSRLLEVFKVRKCVDCGQVKYVWTQIVFRIDTKTSNGWMCRSFPIKREDVRKPWLIGHESKRPLATCRCLGKNGKPRPSVIEQLAKGAIVNKGVGVSRDELLTPSSKGLW